MRHRNHDAIDHVVHVAPRADLRSVSMDLDRLVSERAFNENTQRSFPDLTATIYVERAHDSCGQLSFLPVGNGKMLLRKLAHGVRPPCFANLPNDRAIRLRRAKRTLAEDFAC